MKVLLTGATGYIGKRLMISLLDQGHHLVCLVRSPERLFIPPDKKDKITVVVGNLADSSCSLPTDIDAAYYLIHSMTAQSFSFTELEKKTAQNFLQLLLKTKCRQIIYLSGLSNSPHLSPHLQSRKNVEMILAESSIPLTVLRAGIVIGSGSASFEIIRDLVEKLPLMVAPRWINCRCQPIAIYDVIDYLTKILLLEKAFNHTFDIGGPDVLTYKEMLLELARLRGLKRWIFSIPLLTPRLSSLWLLLITSTNFRLARALVESLKNDAVCEDVSIQTLIPKKCLGYREALERAFSKIEENAVISSWKDAWSSSHLKPELSAYVKIPKEGCLTDLQSVPVKGDYQEAIERLFAIGGNKGWYYMNWAWHLRGLFDQLIGGVGLRRGRTHIDTIQVGDALDFWRVIFVDKEKGRLLLYAEMKLPGEAWLEFNLKKNPKGEWNLSQQAIFRPKGLAGRLYWFALFPIHYFIFRGMCRAIARG